MALLGNLTGSSQYFNDDDFYAGAATQSLRFDDGSSAYLTRTPDSASNRDLWTLSLWVKRSNVGTSGTQSLYGVYTDGNNQETLAFDSGGNVDKLYWQLYQGGSAVGQLTTNRLFRDVSSWYHIVIAYDSANSTAGNRMRMYINGVEETSFATDTNPSSGLDSQWNSTTAHTIGRINTTNYFDGYIAEVNSVDGQALDPTYFGETKNGVWIPKSPNVTYGTNGFHLNFNQTGVGTASTSTIGADTSGNTHHFTSSGIVASDCNMPDSPENNFATFNSVDPSNPTFSEGNLKVAFSGSGNGTSRSTIGITSGKWYAEFYQVTVGNGVAVGAVGEDASISAWPSIVDGSVYVSGGLKNINGTESSYGTGYSDGDIIGVALDMDAGSITLYLNNSSEGVMNTGLSGEHFISFSDGSGATSGTAIANFGQDSSFVGTKTAQGNTDANGIGDFYYAPPSGYLALCTANLPEPTIGPNADTQADDYFNTVLYTGNVTDDTAIAVDFQPDWVWIKKRSDAQEHVLFDSNRGATKRLFSNLTNAESDEATSLKAFTSSGFTLGSHSSVNDNTETFVAWNWKANGGTTSSNSDGSITSTVQANTTAGFSIVTYTGSESNATVGHGLGGVPDMLIWKKRNGVNDWIVYHSQNTSAPATDHLHLNNTNATSDPSGSTFFQDTLPTSTVFSIGTDDDVNDAKNYVVYCFRSIEGYSKFGSYTGNSNVDGTFVYTGFRPAWVMIKWTAGASDWRIWDSTRDTYNPATAELLANSNVDEETPLALDVLSNGFKPRVSDSEYNLNNNTYVYMAFAEAPFKYANAR